MDFTRLARDFTAVAQAWLSKWPGDEELNNDRNEAAASYNAAQALLGDAIDTLITDSSISPTDLSEILGFLQRRELLDAVPEWVWLLDDDSPSMTIHESKDAIAYARALLRPEIRDRVRLLLHHIDDLGEPTVLRWLDAPPPGDTADEHLHRWFTHVRDFLHTAPNELVSALKAGAHDGADLEALMHDANRLPYLTESVQPSVASAILDHLNTLPAPAQNSALAEFCAAVDFYKTAIGDPSLASFEVLLHLRQRHQELRPSASAQTLVPHSQQADHEPLVLNHDWMIDSSRTRASLVLKRPDPTLQYRVLTAPLVLETTRLRSIRIRIEWRYRDIAQDGAWPRSWPRPEPEGAISIPVYAWRLQQSPSTYHYYFSASYPIRTPSSGKLKRFDVRAIVRDDRTGHELATKDLRWEVFHSSPQKLTVKWQDQASPEYVRQHPIGPQLRANTILQRLRSGSSVAVTAPRRFGKSSLVAYLAKELATAQILAPDQIECTLYNSSTGFDHQRLWSDLSESLQGRVGATIDRVDGFLPGPKAFDHVRRAARQKGYSAVVLLFDEAQLLFPTSSGWEIGSRLKTLLANYWSRTDDSSLAPVLFCLVGLPSLSRRAGADVMGLLHPIEHDAMDEPQLRPLIRQIADGLQTSRDARSKLAETAGNLLVLRAMLDSLTQRLDHDERTWANYNDVVAVEEELKRHLQKGKQEHVACWIRDVLNGADRVEDWRPLPCFPTAVAFALTRSAGRGFVEGISETVNKLNDWCHLFGQESADIMPIYDAERVKEHLAELQERQIVNASSFASGFLEAWLAGVGRRSAFDDAFRDALVQGAYRQVTIPKGATRVATGGQATIWRDGDRAYRVRTIGTEQERRLFLEGTAMLGELRKIVARRESGSDHIFEILDGSFQADRA